MKKLLFIVAAFLCLCESCKKQPLDPTIHLPVPPAYMDSVQAFLKHQLSPADYSQLDFTQYTLSKQGAQWYWKIAIKEKTSSTDFLLLQSDSLGHFTKGKWIEFQNLSIEKGLVNGNISMISMDRLHAIHSKITRGYIEALHPALFGPNLRTASHPDPYQELQEVIIVAYRPSSGNDFSFNTYMLFQSMMADLSGGGDYNTGIYSNGEGNGSGNATTTDIVLNIEPSPWQPGIDLNAWLLCFQLIPDEGAQFSISLLADLPVDDDPSIHVNLYTGATGHCFLQLQKTNGAQSVTQVLGFTAENPLTALVQADAFVPSKMVNNANHKYDASITMQVNASAFAGVLEKMKELTATMAYSITRFDCLDYALGVINTIRGNDPLVLPARPAPVDAWTQIGTGGRLFLLLQSMKEQGDKEAPNIFVGGPVFAGSSHGPCN